MSALAACGSDSEPQPGDTGAESIKVMVYGPFDATGFSIPGIETAARAGVDKVNDEGGINGRKLELIACNDNNDPNTAAGCARQAILEDVVAVTGGLSIQETRITAALNEAGIPVIGNVPVADFATANQYPFVGGGAGVFLGLAKVFASSPECQGKASAVLEDLPSANQTSDLLETVYAGLDMTYTDPGKAPPGASDFGPALAAADEAPCLTLLTTPQTTPQVLTAAASNPGIALMGSSDSALPGAAVEQLGDVADGFVVVNEFLPLNDATDDEGVAEFLQRARAIDSAFDPDASAASAYLAPQVLKAALEKADVTDPTGKDAMKALDSLSHYDTGFGPVLDFSQKNPASSYARLPYHTSLYTWIVKDGTYVLDESRDPIDLSDIYDALAASE